MGSAIIDFLDKLANSRPTNAALQEQRQRANQGPAITQAQASADGAQTSADAAAALFDLLFPIGCSQEWNGSSDPPGGRLMLEDGRLLNQADYPDLFAVLGTSFNTGGEGTGQFRIPDSRGRVAVGAGQGSGLTNRVLGTRFGEEAHVLSAAEMPVHNHPGSTDAPAHAHNVGGNFAYNISIDDAYQITGTFGTGAGARFVIDQISALIVNSPVTSSVAHAHTVTTNAAGSGFSHNNVQPGIAKNKVVRVL